MNDFKDEVAILTVSSSKRAEFEDERCAGKEKGERNSFP